jgi:hypothetical protein
MVLTIAGHRMPAGEAVDSTAIRPASVEYPARITVGAAAPPEIQSDSGCDCRVTETHASILLRTGLALGHACCGTDGRLA